MSNPKLTTKLLNAFAVKQKSPSVNFGTFEAFVKRYADKHVKQRNDLSIYSTNTKTVLSADLEELATQGTCTLDYEDMAIVSIQFPLYLLEAIESQYKDIESDSSLPFPTTDFFADKIPEEVIQVVNVKNDFVSWIGRDEPEKSFVMRLEFPEGFKNIMLSSKIFFNSLLELSLDKVRRYLQDQSNFNYVNHKLAGIMANEVAVQPFLEDIVGKSTKTLETIEKPTDFTFRVWTTLGNVLIHDIKQKASKLVNEISLCQAAYLIGFYNVRNKGIEQRKKDSETNLKQLELALKQAPYFYTLQEIYNLKNPKGIPFMKNCGKEQIHELLEKRSKSEDKRKFPELIRVRTEKKKEYYINKDTLLILLLKKIDNIRTQIRNDLIEGWGKAFWENKKLPEMKSDEKYEEYIAEKIREGDPLLWMLLRFELLFLLSEEAMITAHVRGEVHNMVDPKEKALKSIPEILKLEREEMLEEVKSRLPVWMTAPVLSGIVRFFRRLFHKSKKEKKKKKPAAKAGKQSNKKGKIGTSTKVLAPSGASVGTNKSKSQQTAKAKLTKFREHMSQLQEEYVAEGKSVEHTLEGLVDKWNNLLDMQARKNLVEDVNSAIRDYLRRFKNTLIASPPDADHLQRIAIRLSEQPIFSGIKRKEDFWRYIELYIIKLLVRE